MRPSDIEIRPCAATDAAALAEVYAWHVRHGTGTFETEPPSTAEMARRMGDVLGNGWPWIVAVSGKELLGYAYANHFRPRGAYRYCVEDSIYVRTDVQGCGIGGALLSILLAQCEARGARQMLAVIGDSANAGSIGLHKALGFESTGIIRSAGWKLERWLDVVLMQRSLGPGGSTPAP
jgi:L-amino acid N-acyltransferase YncA